MTTDPRLSTIIGEARRAHGEIAVAEETFAEFLGRLLDAGELDTVAAEGNAGDLLLACASAAGDPTTLAEVDRMCVAPLDRALAGIVPAHSIDEVKQRVRQLLFVADPGRAPKITSYAGRASLRTWVRAVAIRVAMRVRRESGAGPPEAELVLGHHAAEADMDPGLRALRDRHAAAFRAALESALRSLSPEERTLLRRHFVDEVGTEDLARLHGVHRVTMFRRLNKLRRRLLALTRRELARRIQSSPSELDSIIRAVSTCVDITLERVLASDGEGSLEI